MNEQRNDRKDKPQARAAAEDKWERTAGTDRPGSGGSPATPQTSTAPIKANLAARPSVTADTTPGTAASTTDATPATTQEAAVQAEADGSLNPDRKPAFAEGEHPLGTVAGAAAGTVAGAVVGMGAGPIGSIVGAAAGAVAGAMFGSRGPTDTGVERGPLEAPEARDTATAEDVAARQQAVQRDMSPGQGTTGRPGGLPAPHGLPFDPGHWRSRYESRPAVDPSRFEGYLPAYRLGHEAWDGRSWAEGSDDLRVRWAAERGESPLSWEDAEPAMREAWEARAERERERR